MLLSLRILKEACSQSQYSCIPVDNEYSGLLEISNGKKSFFTYGLAYPLNPEYLTIIARDKIHMYRILKNKKYKIPEGKHFFVNDNFTKFQDQEGGITEAIKYAKNKYPVFVKPNKGSLGKNAKVIHHEKELREHLHTIGKDDFIALVQEYIQEKEYRVYVLDGEVQFFYQKQGQGIELSVTNYSENIPEALQQWVKKITTDFPLRVMGIDVFASDITNPETFTIIEINGNPSLRQPYKLGKKEKVYSVWKKIMNIFFNE